MRRCLHSAIANARLLIVGLAPGMQGANRTGRPVHRRLRRRSALRDPARIRLCQGRLSGAARRRAEAGRLPDQQRGALRAAAEQAVAGRDQHLPAIPGRRPSRPCRSCARSWRSAASRMTSTVKALGLRAAAAPFAHGADASGRRAQALRQLSLLALQHEHACASVSTCAAKMFRSRVRCKVQARRSLERTSDATDAGFRLQPRQHVAGVSVRRKHRIEHVA